MAFVRLSCLPRRGSLFSTTVIGLVAVAAAACSSSSSPTTTTAPRASSTTYPAFIKVVDPSDSAKMICGTEGQAVVAAALNETTTKVTTPTWNDHVYACDYVYKTGTLS